MPLSPEDKFAIMELTAKYNFAVDHQRPQDWLDTFTQDGELLVNGKSQAKGRDALDGMARRIASDKFRARRWTCNTIIDGEGSTARLRMYVLSISINDGIRPTVMGEYDDTLVKVDGEWRFQTRRITFCGGKSEIVEH